MREEGLSMKVELTVIEDLGIKLYGKLPPVISEMVANAWDADARRVDIVLPIGSIKEDSKITVRDCGSGMSYADIADKYLRIGRKRREEEHGDETAGGRRVMGRKGIGKLSIFGAAKKVKISTVSGGRKNVFAMDIDKILKEARKTKEYNPEAIKINEKTGDKDGTEVVLTGLKRTTKIDPTTVRRDLAKHFSVFGRKFRMYVNGDEITTADKWKDVDIEQEWRIENERVGGEKGVGWTVSGKIIATKKPLPEADLGIAVMARGKLIQSPTMFDVKPGSKHAYSYITGEIAAEFFDDDTDLISTNRQSVIWDNPKGESLKCWGQKKLKELANELQAVRTKKREREIREQPRVREWLESLAEGEKRTADKIIRLITSDDDMGPDRKNEIMEYVMDSFEHKAFQDMVESLDNNREPLAVLHMFKTWNVIEAREMFRIVHGRLGAIEQLARLVDLDAKEVPDMHKYFEDWPWVLDPTLTKWQHEARFSKMLSEKYPEAELKEKDRRIDFVATNARGTIYVIEIKRPRHKVDSKDMDQLADYVTFIESKMGNANSVYNQVEGYIIAGGIKDDRRTRRLVNEGKEFRRYVRTYEDLVSQARTVHSEFLDKIEMFQRQGKK